MNPTELSPTPTLGVKWPTNIKTCTLIIPVLSPYKRVYKEAATRWSNVTNFKLSINTHINCPTLSCFTAYIRTVENASWAGLCVYSTRGGFFSNVRCFLNRKYTDNYILEKQISVATHEFGHAMGLDHHPDDTSIMTEQPRTATTPQQDDIDAINGLYPTFISNNEVTTQNDFEKRYYCLLQWAKKYNNTDELYRDADIVVQGLVSVKHDATSREKDSFHTYCTPYEITVNNILKMGEKTETTEATSIIVDLIGGQVNDITLEMKDGIELPLTKEVLLFLKEGDESYYLINENTSIFIKDGTKKFRHVLTDKTFSLEEIQSGITFV
ncbi:TPA: matrixin family metalloprotease [Bacillus thuringiensis]|nr:matrixin family metalloprotease [Bacillus cereus]HDR4798601.1 matrixin family metalloprotease [Bacillus cereus]HDR4804616.1 matrixin family metalloprotease [Bacillus cereus]HDR4810555.1 matrixin family metalloprotease [Bacillus cereus]HDR4833020.1 matrixin family metalloprotease [Bacillus cereus]